MGSYNVSCAVSKLPVMPGDKVKLLFLVENTRNVNLDASAYWHSLLPCFLDATYDDYGCFSIDASDTTHSIIMDILKSNALVTDDDSLSYTDTSINYSKLFRIIQGDRIFMKPTYVDKVCTVEHKLSDYTGVYTSLRPRKLSYMVVRDNIINKMCERPVYKDSPIYEDGDLRYEDKTLLQIGTDDCRYLTKNIVLTKSLIIGLMYSSPSYSLGRELGLCINMYEKLRSELQGYIDNNETELKFLFMFSIDLANTSDGFERIIHEIGADTIRPHVSALVEILDKFELDMDNAVLLLNTIRNVYCNGNKHLYYDHNIKKPRIKELVSDNSLNTQILNGFLPWLYNNYNSYMSPTSYVGECGDIDDHFTVYQMMNEEAEHIYNSYNDF